MTYIVVLGLVVVVVLVVVLVALGLRAGRSPRDEDDWITEDQPRGRRASDFDGEDELDHAYGTGYDRRVAGAPLSPPPPGPAQPGGGGPARPAEKLDDDDYWATITFDKPKFPWQHDNGTERPPNVPDPLDEHRVAEQQPPPQPSPLAAPSMAAGPLDMPAQPLPQSRPIDPLDGSLPLPSAPGGARPNDPLSGGRGPLGTGDPLGLSTTRADAHDPEATQVYAADSASYGDNSYSDGSYGDNSYGDGPSYGPGDNNSYSDNSYSDNSYSDGPYGGSPGTYAGTNPGSYGNSTPNSYGGSASALQGPLSSSTSPGLSSGSSSPPISSISSGSTGDSDSHRLPTVDELLQRIQADRRKSNTQGSPAGDPLTDPLTTGPRGGVAGNTGPQQALGSMSSAAPMSGGDAGYGPGNSWPNPTSPANTTNPPNTGQGAPAPSPAFGTDPLGIGTLGGGQPTGNGLSTGGGYAGAGSAGSSTGSPADGYPADNYPADGYPSAPVYGEAPRYDDPLGGYGGMPGGRGDSYGSVSRNSGPIPLQSPPPAAEEPSRYSDFTGSSTYGGDPLGTTGGYGTASGSGSGGAGQAPAPGYYGSPPPDQNYGPPPEPSYGAPTQQPDPGYGQPGGNTGGQQYPPGNYGGAPYGPGPGPAGGYSPPEPSTQPQPQQRGTDEWDTYRGDYRS